MKQIESKLKTPSQTWLTPVLLIFIAFFAMAMVSPVNAAPPSLGHCGKDFCDQDGDGWIRDHRKCPNACNTEKLDTDDYNCADPDPDGCGGSSGGGNELGPYNLARASFATLAELNSTGGITADGWDTCTIDRDGDPATDDLVTYDYWAWEERLLGDDESIHRLHVPDKDPYGNPCNSHANRSDVSGGGRWKLSTTAGPDATWFVARWLDVDFSNRIAGDECPDLYELGIYGHDKSGKYQHPDPNFGDCVVSLNVWISNRFMLKKNADFGGGGMTIAHWPETDGSGGWRPWGKISYEKPLHLWDPDEEGPFAGRDCTVMSTRPAYGEKHDRMRAVLYKKEDDGTNTPIGIYNLPQEVCVIRASD
jgi:hypothetical protein